MKKFLLENFATSIATSNLNTILLNNVMAIVIGLFVFLIYRVTYSGTAYSKKFNVSLGMMAIVTTLIMNVISNNIALSLGMVGALSIIRFRTAVKDVRDATFIFWVIAVGICCGVSQYIQAAIGSVAIALFLIVMKQTSRDGHYLVIIRSTPLAQSAVEAAVQSHFSNDIHLRVRNVSRDSSDLIYEVSQAALDKAFNRRKSSLAERLMKIEGVISVDQVEQTDGVSR